MNSVLAELLVLRKRVSTWILLGIWAVLTAFFAYVLPYVEAAEVPTQLLPEGLAGNVIAGFPFFGGVFALILGVLGVGSEYGWNTFKTLFTQGPGRLRMFAAKLLALALALAPFVLVAFLVGAVGSYAIAQAEAATVSWPSTWLLARSLGGGWLILAVWGALGVLLAVLSRGTALAIGLGILYALVIEGLASALVDAVSWLESLSDLLLRTNAYSFAAALGLSPEAAADGGPGSFFGPFVDGGRAAIVLAAYIALFLLVSAVLLRRRDVD
ncbi:MAG: ABC transporter permease [Actinomycetota bacterium]